MGMLLYSPKNRFVPFRVGTLIRWTTVLAEGMTLAKAVEWAIPRP